VATVDWTGPALRDLEAIWAYIARDSEQAADLVRARLFNASERLEDFPFSGRILPEAESESIREVIVGSYRVIYHLISEEEIEVVAVIHGARSLTCSQLRPPGCCLTASLFLAACNVIDLTLAPPRHRTALPAAGCALCRPRQPSSLADVDATFCRSCGQALSRSTRWRLMLERDLIADGPERLRLCRRTLLLADADITIGNMDRTFTGGRGRRVYLPDAAARDREAGFDVVAG
jgi:addiction module RelE/StbE family toxin